MQKSDILVIRLRRLAVIEREIKRGGMATNADFMRALRKAGHSVSSKTVARDLELLRELGASIVYDIPCGAYRLVNRWSLLRAIGRALAGS